VPALLQIGTDHTLAPLAVRERLALEGESTARLLQQLHADPAVEEAAVLATCNRVEVYLAAMDGEAAYRLVRRAFATLLADDAAALDTLLVTRKGVDAVRHLCAVAAGLESMVVAEGQILGQVRQALETARRLGTVGLHLGAVFRAAVACGKRVRSETAIGRADISAGSSMIALLERSIDDWSAQRALLIGAGRMNAATAHRLRALGVGDLTITSRTLAAAQTLAAAVGGRAIGLDGLPAAARRATLIISATRSPGLMLTAPMLAGRSDEPLVVCDLAVPRDVDPLIDALPGVRLLDIDALRDSQLQEGLSDALVAAEAMVEGAVGDWTAWCRTREAVPLIADLRAHVDRQKEAELARTLGQLAHLSEVDQAAVGELAHRLVNKMFHHLAIRMKQAAADPALGDRYLEVARFLFGRDESPDAQPPQVTSSVSPLSYVADVEVVARRGERS
jgi:glutamyl-tRNA reductase